MPEMNGKRPNFDFVAAAKDQVCQLIAFDHTDHSIMEEGLSGLQFVFSFLHFLW